MFIFNTNSLKNQQKNRRSLTKINKFSWISKTFFAKDKYLFFAKNQQSIDLRVYKIILRKFKKKMFKKKISIFFFLYPNKKLSNKSKNSRMGKGKGLFNRFYCCLKKIKPVFILKNINTLKCNKLKNNFINFLNIKF